jgi:hypothetical protein
MQCTGVIVGGGIQVLHLSPQIYNSSDYNDMLTEFVLIYSDCKRMKISVNAVYVVDSLLICF